MCDVLNGAGPIPATSEVVIAVPTLHLSACKFLLNEDIALAAQDVSFKKGYGAFTGEHSAEMLVDSRIKWTLTGHSERRVGFGFPVISFAADLGVVILTPLGRDKPGRGSQDEERC